MGSQSNYYIEKIQLNYCKLLLGVKSSANTSAVLGECGRLPLSIDLKCKCVKHWLKLQLMPHARYQKQAYMMLKRLEDIGRTTWAGSIKLLSNTYGFGHVWLEHGVGDGLFLVHF